MDSYSITGISGPHIPVLIAPFVTGSEEDEDDMVMVEVDEAFVVKPLTGSGDQADPKHKCILCGRIFRFYENLQVHLTGHLGVKVKIFHCHLTFVLIRCNFRAEPYLWICFIITYFDPDS
jgi:hypothetical protein